MSVQTSVNLVTHAPPASAEHAGPLPLNNKIEEEKQPFGRLFSALLATSDEGTAATGGELGDLPPLVLDNHGQTGDGNLLPIYSALLLPHGQQLATHVAPDGALNIAELSELIGDAVERGDNTLTELRSRLLSFIQGRAGGNIAEGETSAVNASRLREAVHEFIGRPHAVSDNTGIDLEGLFSEQSAGEGLDLDSLLSVLGRREGVLSEPSQRPLIANLTSALGLTPVTGLQPSVPLEGVIHQTNAVPQSQVAVPLHHAQWGDDFSQRVRWLISQNVSLAEIRINPPELGPIDVRVNVSGDQVSVALNSQFAVVREALEAALPRLRELLESQGLNLANADIGRQSAHGGDRSDRDSGVAANSTGAVVNNDSDSELEAVASSLPQRIASSLIDHYA